MLDVQLASARQELAIKAAELSHMTSALQEHKDSIAHTRSQLASVQDNLGGQLRALQSGTQAEKLQSDREIGRLTQEGEMGVAIGLFDSLVGTPCHAICRILQCSLPWSTFRHSS